MTRLITIIIILDLISTILQASWPSFTIPTKEQLQNASIIDVTSCANGFGKVHKGTMLPVGKNSMQFCPHNWLWTVMNDSECFNLNQLDYISHTIEYVQQQQSIITAYYGIQGIPTFSLLFTTPDLNWHCCEMNKAIHLISCANDM